MATRRLAVASGYATLDYVVELAESFDGTGTVAMRHRGASAWPRAGGAPLYACRPLAAAGFDAAPLTWIGGDGHARRYLDACRDCDLNLTGIAESAGAMSATCVLMYQPDGRYGCLFDPGARSEPEAIGPRQRMLLETADLVILAVGPPALAAEIVTSISPDAIVAWIAKADHATHRLDVRQRYAGRADYIFCNTDEYAFVESSLPGGTRARPPIIETRGGDGVTLHLGSRLASVPVSRVSSHDTTGAGDTFAGAFLAEILGGEPDPVAAAMAAAERTASFLAQRSRT